MKKIILILFFMLLSCSVDSAPVMPEEYTLSNLVYVTRTADQISIQSVDVELTAPAAGVQVGFSDERLHTCASTSPFTHWSCNLNGEIFTGGMALQVVISI